MPAIDPTLRETVRLPDNVTDLKRKSNVKKTLNDLVEVAYLKLYNNQEFQKFLEAIYDEEAEEGAKWADDLMAAQMIRQWAKENGDEVIAEKNLVAIKKALTTVTRRYGESRSERLNKVNGVLLARTPEDHDGPSEAVS